MIGCGKPTGIQAFCEATGFNPNKMYVDPELKVYRLFNLTRAKSFGEIKGKSVSKESRTGMCSGFCWSCCGMCKQGKQGDVYQLGGSFLVGPGERVDFQQNDESSQDHITAEEVR